MKSIKHCPPGVICVENMTLAFIILAIAIILIYVYLWFYNSKKGNDKASYIIQNNQQKEQGYESGITADFYDGGGDIRLRPNVAYTNTPRDVLLNPYAPPLRDERYLVADIGRGGIPINVSTSVDAVDTSYRQLGLLTPTSGDPNGKILPLMGRPLFVSRDKWQYYTMSEQRNSIKLPIISKGRSATTEYGIDKLYEGDTVYVEGYNEPFKITIYDNEVIKYLPFI